MSTHWTRRLVDILIGLVAIAVLGKLIQTGFALAEGAHTVSYEASSTFYEPRLLSGTQATWNMNSGLIVVTDLVGLRLFRILVQFTLLGLFVAALWKLRGLLSRLSLGEVFVDQNIQALRRIGQFLLISCALGVFSTVVIQFVILDAIPELEGRVIHPSISWDVEGVENIWLEYSPPIMTLILALLAFSTAGAFQSGKAYREDSESVI